MKYQILSLSGGGFLGLYGISVLAEVDKHIDGELVECFDLLCGTSIGGIVALALAANVPPRDIRDAFEENGKNIFGSRPPPHTKTGIVADVFRSLWSSKYKNDCLKIYNCGHCWTRNTYR